MNELRNTTPHTIRRHGSRREVRCPFETAREAIAPLRKGDRLTGMTKGQFSLLDLIRAILEVTGPADLTLSTWTLGIRDAENAAALTKRGTIRSLRLLTDRSFPTRQPRYCAYVLDAFGDASIRVTNTHAKFAIIRNDGWSVVVRSSMNLNRNPRFEQFDLDEDEALADFFDAHVSEMEDLMPEGFQARAREVRDAFERALGGTAGDGAPGDSPDSSEGKLAELFATLAADRRESDGSTKGQP